MDKALEAWDRFWFEKVSTATVALMRIAFGLLVTLWSISLFHDTWSFFSTTGIHPQIGPTARGSWTVFQLSDSRTVLTAALVVLLLAGIAMTVGWHSRVASVLIFIGVMSFIRRDPYVFNNGDVLLKAIAFFMMFAPTSAAVSLSRYRKHRADFWQHPKRAAWPLRLMQIQMSVIYVAAVWDKVRGVTWNDGTAVSYAQRLDDLVRFRLPGWITGSEPMANLFTFGTLAVELSLGILVWNKKLRPWVLLLGVGLHLGIDLTIRVGFFSYTILLLYLAFVSGPAAERFFSWLRGRARRADRRAEAATPPPESPAESGTPA